MSNQNPYASSNAGSAGSSCAKAAGYGCLTIFGLFLLFIFIVSSLLGGGNPTGTVVLVVVIAVVAIAAAVDRQNRKNRNERIQKISVQQPSATLAARAVPSSTEIGQSTNASIGAGSMQSPLCVHTFSTASLEGNDPLVCGCGYSIEPADLREYLLAEAQIKDLTARKAALRSKMLRSIDQGAKLSAAPKPQTAVQPRVQRPKRAFSTQQWLVIGASLLIFVAGMIFVSTNLNRLPQWAFEAITGGLALLTAAGASYMRKISSLIATFFAAFSASMQLATLAIVGDQLNESFFWNTLPAWWWLISLGVIAVVAGLLAKFTRLFGWKAIALVATVASVLVLELGLLADRFISEAAAIHLSMMTVGAVAVLWLTKAVRRIPTIEEIDDSLKEYAADLQEREDKSLRIFGVSAAVLVLTAGAGVFLRDYLPIFNSPLEPLSLASLAAVWLGVSATSGRWSGQARSDGKSLTELASISRYVTHIAVTLLVVALGQLTPILWLSALIAVGGTLVANLASGRLTQVRPTPFTSLTVFATSALVWILWSSAEIAASDQTELVAAIIAGSAASLMVSEIRYGINRFAWETSSALGLALIWFAATFDPFADRTGVAFAALTLVLLVVANLIVPLRKLVAIRVSQPLPKRLPWVGLFVAGAVAIVQLIALSLQTYGEDIFTLLPMTIVFVLYTTGAMLAPLKIRPQASEKWLPSAHFYFGQLVVVLIMIAVANSSQTSEAQQATYALLLLCLATQNYVAGWINSRLFELVVGLVFALSVIIPTQYFVALHGLPLVDSLTVISLTGLLLVQGWLLKKRLNVEPSVQFSVAVIGATVGLLLMTFVGSYHWTVSSLVDQLVVQGVLWAFAVLPIVMQRLNRFKGKVSTRVMLWTSFVYTVFAALISLLPVGYPESESDPKRWQWLFSSLVLGLVSIYLFRATRSYWLVPASFVAMLAAGFVAGDITSRAFELDAVPEPHSLWMAALLVATTWLLGNGVERFRNRLLLDIPVLGVALASLGYALAYLEPISNESSIRGILSLAVVASFAYFKVSRERPIEWSVLGYLSATGAALFLGRSINFWTGWDYEGPELYTLLVMVGVLVSHRMVLPHLPKANSWVRWGLPMAIGVLPSAVETAVVANIPFAELTSTQIVRAVLVLVVSIALLVFGVRLGNLANTAVGLFGLAMLLVPNAALQSENISAGSQVEITALVIGVLVYIALWVLKRAEILAGRSTVFIGIPVAIVMAPALIKALVAPTNPSLTGVDWWRFGILLTAGMALLIVGALRELGGMFFPGLASVLLTALPYAFMQSKDQEWFLWVVLLIVATVMIWVALRLEKLRKVGRDSANWLRELK